MLSCSPLTWYRVKPVGTPTAREPGGTVLEWTPAAQTLPSACSAAGGRFLRLHLFACCLMGNRWHLLVRPTEDGLRAVGAPLSCHLPESELPPEGDRAPCGR